MCEFANSPIHQCIKSAIRQSVNPPIQMIPPIRQSANSPITAVSPGRLDVMGGIADYSGSLLLQMPIRETTIVQLTITGGQTITISTNADEQHQQFSIDIDEVKNLPYEAARALVKTKPGGKWAYIYWDVSWY